MMKHPFALFLLLFIAFAACSDSQSSQSAIPFYSEDLEEDDLSYSGDIVVPFRESGGVKYITVKINGVTMDMIFDTGCSGVSLSLNEAITLIKREALSESDVLGTAEFAIASGEIMEGTIINLQTIAIEGKGGEVLIPNVKASVVDNMTAPVLLGNGVLDETYSYSIDNIDKTIKFKRKQ